jgi:hypothetical protein
MTQKRPAAAFAACGRWVGGGAAPNGRSGAAREQHAHSRGRHESCPQPRVPLRGWVARAARRSPCSRAPPVCVGGVRLVLGGARARSHVAERVGVGL